MIRVQIKAPIADMASGAKRALGVASAARREIAVDRTPATHRLVAQSQADHSYRLTSYLPYIPDDRGRYGH